MTVSITPDKKRAIKNALYGEFARVGKAVSSPRRLELLDLLSQGEKSVELLADQSNLPIKNTSAQLKVLRSARLVEFRKDGQRVFYRLSSNEVVRFWLCLRSLGETQYAEVRDLAQRFFSDPSGLGPIDRQSLLGGVRRGEIIVIDVRPSDEYSAGHLPGALSIPVSELPGRLESLEPIHKIRASGSRGRRARLQGSATMDYQPIIRGALTQQTGSDHPRGAASDFVDGLLPKNKQIVAYCRGPYCVYANEAVALLRKKGYRAARFEDGVHEWREAGLPIEALAHTQVKTFSSSQRRRRKT